MLITISTTHQPATDLGFLLHKNPNRLQTFELSFGKAHIFYPIASSERCTAVLLLDIDPVSLVRGGEGKGFRVKSVDQYVNDRPYVASSFMSVAIAQTMKEALGGRSREKPELAEAALPLEVSIPVLPCRGGGEALVRKIFEPLGYEVQADRLSLDSRFPEWGDSPYFSVVLKNTLRLSELLSHLYVLIPVLDNDKHYYVSIDEVEKLIQKGEAWLSSHPQKDLIVFRYLKRSRWLVNQALDRLVDEDTIDTDEIEEGHAEQEAKLEEKISLNEQRMETVVRMLRDSGAKTVLDLGCGEGKLLRRLLGEMSFEKIVGMDVSYRSLEKAQDKLGFERMSDKQRQRIELLHGSLMYRDKRLSGFDAAAVVEVIEHLDYPRLHALERVLFEFAKPKTVVVTTPNREYNVLFENLPVGKFRHADHRFEWTRQEFETWAQAMADRYDYSVRFAPIGPEDPVHGAPTQMGVFTR
jgi:3' terminal RNA ribose 2'-O-methyltransferase Hen1